jgi:hypothetical protein
VASWVIVRRGAGALRSWASASNQVSGSPHADSERCLGAASATRSRRPLQITMAVNAALTTINQHGWLGGAEGSRTPDLLSAIHSTEILAEHTEILAKIDEEGGCPVSRSRQSSDLVRPRSASLPQEGGSSSLTRKRAIGQRA